MNARLRMLDFALVCLWQHKWHHLATLLVHGFVVFILGSVLLLTTALNQEAKRLLAAAPEIIVQRLIAGRHDWIPLSYGDQIKGIRGVASVSPRLWGYYFDPPSGGTFTLLGVERVSRTGTAVIQGSGCDPDAPWSCVVGAGVAEARLLEPGGLLPVKGSRGGLYALRVSEVFSGDNALLTHDLVLLRPDSWRQVFGVAPGVATDLVVHVPNAQEVDTVSRKIAERLPDVRVIGRETILKTYEAAFGWRGSLVMLAFGGALAAFGIMAIDRARSLGAEERRNLGVLRAVGWSVPDILRLKLWEGMSLSLLAFVTGALAAHLHVFQFGGAALAPLLRGWSAVFPALCLKPQGEMFQLMILFLVAVVPFVLAALGPAWTAANVDADRILRE